MVPKVVGSRPILHPSKQDVIVKVASCFFYVFTSVVEFCEWRECCEVNVKVNRRGNAFGVEGHAKTVETEKQNNRIFTKRRCYVL